jgi:integrase
MTSGGSGSDIGSSPVGLDDRIGRPALADALDAVRNRIRVRGLRSRTAEEYLDEGHGFARWFADHLGRPAALADVTTVNVDSYIASGISRAEDRGRPWSLGTRDHHARQIRALGGHLAAAYGLPANPLAGLSVRVAKGDRRFREADAISDEEFLAILASLDPCDPSDLVTRAIVALGYEAGPRTSEHAKMRIEDFQLVHSAGQELGPVLHVMHPAKTSPKRVLPLGGRCEEVIATMIGARTSGPLFISRTGAALAVKNIQARLREAGRRARVELTAQRLRRSAASWQATYGATAAHLDTVFGWEPDPRDVKSAHYVRLNVVQLLHAHQSRLSPLDRLELRVGPYLR